MARQFTDSTAFDGETLSGTFTAPDGTTAVTVKLADGVKSATVTATANADGTWTATATPETLQGFSGATRWLAFATTPDGTEGDPLACIRHHARRHGGNRHRRDLHSRPCFQIPGSRRRRRKRHPKLRQQP